MTSIIYLISVDSIPKYVGSAFIHRYESRKSEHLVLDKWLQNVNKSVIDFQIIEECDDEIRYDREGFRWEQLLLEGYELENRRDPRKMFKTTSSESAKKSVITKRKQGTASKSVRKGIETRKRNGTWRQSLKKAIETKKSKGNLNVFDKGTQAKGLETKRKNGFGNTGKSTTGHEKQGLIHATINDEKRSIMKEFNCSFKEAGKIRKSRINNDQ